MSFNEDRSGVPDDWFVDPLLRDILGNEENSDTAPLA